MQIQPQGNIILQTPAWELKINLTTSSLVHWWKYIGTTFKKQLVLPVEFRDVLKEIRFMFALHVIRITCTCAL